MMESVALYLIRVLNGGSFRGLSNDESTAIVSGESVLARIVSATAVTAKLSATETFCAAILPTLTNAMNTKRYKKGFKNKFYAIFAANIIFNIINNPAKVSNLCFNVQSLAF